MNRAEREELQRHEEIIKKLEKILVEQLTMQSQIKLLPTWEPKLTCGDPLCQICHPTPLPPKAPRLSEQFTQFMQEDIARRAYIYRYALYPTARCLMAFTPVYFEMNADLYDTAEFLNLLAKIPRECII